MNSHNLEFYAAHRSFSRDDMAQVMNDRKLNPFSKAKLLTAALAMSFKDTAKEHYHSLIGEHSPYEEIELADGVTWLETLGIEQSLFENFTTLPGYCFGIECRFILKRPYISRDDDDFYIIDNPVHKDKVFKIPFISPSSWKGSLRAVTMRRLLTIFSELVPVESATRDGDREDLLTKFWRERVRRISLFGNENESEAQFINHWIASHIYPILPDEVHQNHLKQYEKSVANAFDKFLKINHYISEKIEGRQGRLFFYPTFFNRIGLEIINPHDRQRRVGKNPILFECAPAGAEGTFRLLYVPYDFPGKATPDEAELKGQVQTDLALLAQTVHDLLTVYGFGAKTSSGFGTAEIIKDSIDIQANDNGELSDEIGKAKELLGRKEAGNEQ